MNHTEIPSDMYKEHIMELYKSPSNFGLIENPTHEATEHNSICGDEITVQIITKDKKVEDVKFSGSGCAMSMVSSSLLTDKIKGMEIEEIKKLNQKDILNLLNVKVTPARIKCILLPLEAAKKALENEN